LLQHQNKPQTPRSIGPGAKGRIFAKPLSMPEEARRELVEYFREDTTCLQGLMIERDLSGWLSPNARDDAGRPDPS